MSSWKVVTLVVALLVLALPGFAQQSILNGTVTDDTGAVIVGADVVLLNVDTGVGYSAQTNEAGLYAFPPIQPGTYELQCEFTGFKKALQTGLVMETGLSKNLPIVLEVGSVTETIEVTGAAPLLETENSTVGQFIERTTVAQMPVSSRQAGQLVKLAGNVTFASGGGGLYDLPFFSMAGGRSRNQMWHLDGGVVQNMSLGIAQLNLNPPVESLQEFKVESNNYAAEYGRSGNGLIIMTTRSGTNELHGALYHNFRNDKLDTRTFFAPEVPTLRYNIFGGSIGGPVQKDKSFFFFNYEGQRRTDGLVIANTDVPHAIEKTGDFSNRTGAFALGDPNNDFAPFSNNIIPQSRIDPIGSGLAGFYPDPNAGGGIGGAPRDNFITNTSNKGTSDFYTVRYDHNFSENDRIYGRFSHVSAPADVQPVYPNAVADFRGATQTRSNLVTTINYSHNFAPTMINEFRFTYGRRTFTTRGLGTGSGVNGQLGVPNVLADNFPTVNLTGYSRLGAGNQERLQLPIITYQYVDSLSWFKGKHSFKAGAEMRYSRNRDDFNQFAGGSFDFDNRFVGDSLGALLLGHTRRGRIVNADILNTRTDYWGLYVQDNWKATNKLTVSLGLRWELDTPRWEKENNRQSGFDPSAINPVCDCPGTVLFSERNGRNKYAHDFDTNNFGPRVGLAYRVTDTLVVRSGYGINYNGIYAFAAPFTQFWSFSENLDLISGDGGRTPVFQLADGLPAAQPFTDTDRNPGFGAVVDGRRTTAPDFFQQDQHNGQSQQWNFTVQKQLPNQMLVEAQYMANVAHNLGGRDVSLNMIPLVNGRGPATQSQALRPYPQFSNVLHESPAWGNSTYHALNIKAEKRFAKGLSYLINYTWSKFIDDVEAANEAGGEQGNGYTHVELRHLDKALSGNDIRHRVVASGVWDIPVSFENKGADMILGGWSLGIIAEFRQGTPYGVIEQTNRSNTFATAQRPELIGDPTLSSSRSTGARLAEWFDTGAFLAPGAGVFGGSPRNICCGPGSATIDTSINKKFHFGEKKFVEFRADFFNIANTPNFALPERRRGNSGFGRIRGTVGTGRQLQLGLRLQF